MSHIVLMKFDNCRGMVAAACLLLMGTAHALDMGNMMNPSKWMGGNKNQDRGGDYYGGAPGYGPSPGYYGGPSGRDSGGSNPVGMMPNPMKIFGGNKN